MRASSQVFLLYPTKIKITLIGEYQKLTDVNGKSRVFRNNETNGSSGLSICHTDDSGNLIIFDTIPSLCFEYEREGGEEEEEKGRRKEKKIEVERRKWREGKNTSRENISFV